MLRRLLEGSKYLAIIAVIFSVINAVGLLLLGAYKAVKAYLLLFGIGAEDGAMSPGIYIVESIDTFLVALVMLVLAAGITSLFLIGKDQEENPLPSWMQVNSFLELKLMLWEAVILVLVVAFLVHVSVQADNPKWTLLILPLSILLLTVGLAVMNKFGRHD